MTLDDLKDALRKLDSEARSLLAVAAAEGRFDEVSEMVLIAKDISATAARWASNADNDHMKRTTNSATVRPSPRGLSDGRDKKATYPQFWREKEELVKVGWSARDARPYEHRVPKSILDIITKAVTNQGKSGHRFAMDSVLESATKGNSGQAVPSYQVYAAVLWLKWNGMLLQHGRQGYTIVRPQTFANSVETAWQALPRR